MSDDLAELPSDLFFDVKYYLTPTLSPNVIANVALTLSKNGGVAASSVADATHIITNTIRFEGWRDAKKGVAVVTVAWVERSVVMKRQQTPDIFSPDPAKLFSGVTAVCSSEVPTPDVEVISSGILALGGTFKQGLTRDVTHLFCLEPSGDFYTTAMEFQDKTSVKVLLPHWFDDVVRLGMPTLSTKPYEWPDPPFLRSPGSAEQIEKRPLDPMKKTLMRTATEMGDIEVDSIPSIDLWGRKRVLVSSSLDLTRPRREAIEAVIERGNGVVLSSGTPEEEATRVNDCDVLITNYRSGKAYFNAARQGKIIGTLTWMFSSQAIGHLTSPMDQLLHYPVFRRKIERFDEEEITITNYTGEARDYLKTLIHAMGGVFTPSMSRKNTAIVAASLSGKKTKTAESWSIPVVNHTWLEDCFVQWRNLTKANEKYIKFPQGVDFSATLAERCVSRSAESIAELDKEEEEAEEEEVQEEVQEGVVANVNTQNSAMDAKEVADLTDPHADNDIPMVNASAAAVPMDIDAEEQDEDQPMISQTKSPSPSPPPRKAGPSTLKKRKRMPSPPPPTPPMQEDFVDIQSDSDDDEFPDVSVVYSQAPKKKLPAKSSPPKSKKGKGRISKKVEITPIQDPESELDEATPSPKKQTSINKKAAVKGKGKAKVQVIESEDEDEDKASLPKSKPKSSAKGNAKTKAHVVSDEDALPATSPKRSTKAKALPVSSDDDMEVDVVIPKKSSRKSSTRQKEKEDSEPPEDITPKSSGRVRRPSARAKAASGGDENHKEATTTLAKPTQKGLAKANSIRVATAVEAREKPMSSPSKVEVVITAEAMPVRRKAAAAATQRLHEKVMPDMNQYQKQQRNRSHKGNSWLPDAKDEDRIIVKDEDKKSTKRKSTGGHEGTPESDAPAVNSKKRRKITPAEEAEEATQKRSVRPPSTRGGATQVGDIKLMTTQVALPDDVIKTLISLKVQIVTRPQECTHLLAAKIVRTEKFLSAIAVAPYILNSSWATDSAAAKKILPEKDYVLRDKEGEKKYDFRLSDALSRVKNAEHRIFHAHTFYVTGKVTVDRSLLKNVAAACGAKVEYKSATFKTFQGHEDTRHLISCPEDIAIWRPIKESLENFPVYTTEIILMSVLKQEVDWKGCQVPGSDSVN